MIPANELDQQHRFDKVVDHLIEVGSSLCSSTVFSDLEAPLNSLSKEVAQLRSLIETPTREVHGRPIIDNDFFALQSFNTLNRIERVNQGISLNSAGRIHYFSHENDSVKDLSPLAALTALKQLSLSMNQIKDLSALSALPLLEELYLNYNRELDAKTLAEFKNIKRLCIADTGVHEIGWVTSLSHIQVLSLTSNKITDVQVLVAARELQEVNIDHNPIKSLEPLRHHPNLWNLTMQGTLVEDLSPLLDVPQLTFLAIDRATKSRGDVANQLLRLRDQGVSIEVWT